MQPKISTTCYRLPGRRRTFFLFFLLTTSFWTLSCEGSNDPEASSSSSSSSREETPFIPSSSDADGSPDDNTLSLEVFELTSKNFGTTIGDGNVWLIEFYTPWCKHCQSFKASYMSIAHAFHSSPNEKIRVGRVDCSVERALLGRFDVKGFPSFFLVAGWQVYEFDGIRSEANLMTFARGGFKKQDPIPFFSSPMGPMGLLQGTLIYVGTRCVGMLEWFQMKYGISPIVAGIGLCMVAIFGGMVSVIILAILSTPREKND